MRKVPRILGLSFLALSLGCVADVTPADASAGQGSFHYVLETSVATYQTIRVSCETTYRFFRIESDGGRELVWESVAHEKYERHWITPDGRVWIKTAFVSGPQSGPRLYVRDTSGREEISHKFGFRFLDPNDGFETYWDETEIIQPKGDDSVDLLKVRDSSGKTTYYCTLRGAGGELLSVTFEDGNDNIDQG